MTYQPDYSWQDRAFTAIHSHFVSNDYFFVNAATASGKTRLALRYVKDSPFAKGLNVIVVHSCELVRQHIISAESFGFKEKELTAFGKLIYEHPKAPGHHLVIMTFQALAQANAKRNIATLIWDEVHWGTSDDRNSSVAAIKKRANPKRSIYISATIGNVSEKLLGPVGDNIFRFTALSAFEAGITNDVMLCEIETGHVAVVERIMDESGATAEQLDQLVADDISDLASDLGALKAAIDMEGLKKVYDHRSRVAIDLYLSRHAGESAIFFCPNVAAANHTLSLFPVTSRVKCDTINSVEMTGDQIRDKVELFKTGKIKVMFVVGMLREGFDMPELRFAFDLAMASHNWTVGRTNAFVQKMGRLARKIDGKETSYYYFFRSLAQVYNTRLYSAMSRPELPELIAETDLTDDEQKIVMEADATAAFARAAVAGVVENVEVAPCRVEVAKINGARTMILKSALHLVKDVSGHVEYASFSFRELFSRRPLVMEMLIREYTADPNKPAPSSTSSDYGVIRAAKKGRPDMYKQLVAVAPQCAQNDVVMVDFGKIVEKYRADPTLAKPHRRSTEGRKIARVKADHPELYKVLIEIAPQCAIKDNTTLKDRSKELFAFYAKNPAALPPKTGTPDYAAIQRLKFVFPDIYRELIAIAPQCEMRDKVRLAASNETLIDLYTKEPSRPKPSLGTPEYHRLCDLKKRKPAEYARLLKIAPQCELSRKSERPGYKRAA